MFSVLLSSTGVRLSQHWCGNRLVSATIFGEAEACSHFQASDKPACPMHAKAQQKKCCDQRETIIDGNDYDFEIQAMELVEVPVSIVAIMHYVFSSPLMEAELVTNKYDNHSPPLIGSDILVRFQSFLL
ncbi:MAG: hypothetical protein R2813_10010 [Flavobacteriales bacterium]